MRRFKIWKEWQAEPAGDGEYHVRRIGGYKLPGLAIGGNGRWFVQVAGEQSRQSYPSAKKACEAIVRQHNRAGIEAENRRHEWQPAAPDRGNPSWVAAAPIVETLAGYVAVSAMNLSDWRPGFTRVIFRRVGDLSGAVAFEMPCNIYRAVCDGPSCAGRKLADFTPAFRTGLVRKAPASFTDYYTRGRIVLGEAATGRQLDWELDEFIAAQPA